MKRMVVAFVRPFVKPFRAPIGHARHWLLRHGLLPIRSLDTAHTWRRAPGSLAGRRVCVLASFSADGSLSKHTLFLSRAWQAQGFDVILVVATDDRDDLAVAPAELAHLAGVAVRRNSGYDFGSWATVMQARPDLREASMLALANDSLYGPLDGFAGLIAAVESSHADIVAMTDSYEYRHHFQSFLVFYKPTALRSAAFARFWRGIRGGNREATIQRAEIPQLGRMNAAGLTTDVLFKAGRDASTNPTLHGWRRLVDDGFPFVKVQLLRERPPGTDIAGWDDVMRRHGYDPSLVRAHLGADFDAVERPAPASN